MTLYTLYLKIEHYHVVCFLERLCLVYIRILSSLFIIDTQFEFYLLLSPWSPVTSSTNGTGSQPTTVNIKSIRHVLPGNIDLRHREY